MPDIYELLRAAEVRAGGMTALAKELGRHRQQLYNIKNGKITNFPKPESVPRLARALGVSADVVLVGYAKALGIPVSSTRSRLAARLPAAADDLDPAVEDAVVDLIRALAPSRGAQLQAVEDVPEAARRGRSEGQAGKRAADAAGEESQDPGDIDPA